MAQRPDLYYARRPFRYTADLTVEQGQVIELRGDRNNEALVRLGYFALLEEAQRSQVAQCGRCAKTFLTAHFRERHGERHHQPRPPGAWPVGADGEDEDDAEERRLDREAPLYWDKTQASQR